VLNVRRTANLLLAAVFVLSVSIYSGLSGTETAPSTNQPSNTEKQSEPAVSKYVPLSATVTLRYGSTGESVKTLQQQLNSSGYSLTADGAFGSNTLAAVKSFQSSKGLTADGIVGPLTWSSLGSGTAPQYGTTSGTATLKYGSNGEAVVLLQQKLNSQGYSLTADGAFGSNTLSAVKSFQSSKGLTADGIVGPLTWSALGSVTAAQPPESTDPGDNVLRYGDRGEAVKVLQQKLNVFKYNLSADGVFGAGTSFAVKDFQRVVGLSADGVVGSSTWRALDNTPAVPPYIYDPAQRYQSRVNSNNCPSSTKYYIYVNLDSHVVCILTGSNHNWTIQKIFKCTVGAPATPTITGKYTVKAKGSYFVTENGLICKYYTQIYGDYLFHSILYYPSGGIADSRLGMDLSHGCIRLATENALYIYNNIPSGTGIWIE
jgi:peptidoglycan hydrolase-like protein with peptidoglycan-binding domain